MRNCTLVEKAGFTVRRPTSSLPYGAGKYRKGYPNDGPLVDAFIECFGRPNISHTKIYGRDEYVVFSMDFCFCDICTKVSWVCEGNSGTIGGKAGKADWSSRWRVARDDRC